MTNSARIARQTSTTGTANSRATRQISARLSAAAAGLAAAGIATGYLRYLHRSPATWCPARADAKVLGSETATAPFSPMQ